MSTPPHSVYAVHCPAMFALVLIASIGMESQILLISFFHLVFQPCLCGLFGELLRECILTHWKGLASSHPHSLPSLIFQHSHVTHPCLSNSPSSDLYTLIFPDLLMTITSLLPSSIQTGERERKREGPGEEKSTVSNTCSCVLDFYGMFTSTEAFYDAPL